MKELPLTQGKFALVDDEDYEWLSQWKWTLHSAGYGYRSSHKLQKKFFLHREILKTPNGKITDHINGDRLDNRKCNLRICSYTENGRNQFKRLRWQLRDTSSKFIGVSWDKYAKSWRAYITVNCKRQELGRYKSEIEAAKVRDTYANKLFGKHTRLNFS